MDVLGFQRLSDISSSTVIVTLLLIFLGILYYKLRDRGLPPGPWGFPFFGYWPFLKDGTAHIQLRELKKKYGSVYSFTVMGYLYIHLGTIKDIKDAHVTKVDCFAIRYPDYSVLKFLFDDGVATANGESWKTLRKFFIQLFRELGMSSMKDYMTGPIYDSMTTTVESLKSAAGKPVNIITILSLQCSIILRRMMFNDDGITEEELKELLDAYGKVLGTTSGNKTLLVGEFVRRVILPLSPSFRIATVHHNLMVDILKKIIKRHEETLDEDSIRNLIDSYLKERNERRRKNDPSSEYFTDKALISNLLQFIGDGILGVSVFVSYFFCSLLEFPEEQERIFKELEEVVGPDRQPTLDDKTKLPYTNAFMQEVNRTTDFFPVFTSLVCTKETTLNGYKIPKGAITVPNFWASNRDPDIFEDPDDFKPSRFINKPGKPKTEPPILFGIGKRACPGEPFTMMIVFLFLTTVVKNFRLACPGKFNKKNFRDGNMEICLFPRK